MSSDVHSGGFARNNFFLDLNGGIITDVLAHSLACFFSHEAYHMRLSSIITLFHRFRYVKTSTGRSAAQGQQYSFVAKWWSEGVSFGKFRQPLDISIDSDNNVYVTDTTRVSNQIQKFATNSTFITSWRVFGFGDGHFTCAIGISTDSSDNVYVGDFGENNRIQKFDSNGNFITKWGTIGSGDGQFEEPTSIVLDSSGNVYVVDRGNSRIQVFAPS
jgi:DNA-binding beta-propeller fold protein YncE